MYYATHSLYTSKKNPLRLHVVTLKQGRVHSFFPFDGERQSMLWQDALLLSDKGTLDGYTASFEALLDAAEPSVCGRYLYAIESTEDACRLLLIN